MTSPSHKPSRAEKVTMRSDILSVVNMLSYRLNLRPLFFWSIHRRRKSTKFTSLKSNSSSDADIYRSAGSSLR